MYDLNYYCHYNHYYYYQNTKKNDLDFFFKYLFKNISISKHEYFSG